MAFLVTLDASLSGSGRHVAAAVTSATNPAETTISLTARKSDPTFWEFLRIMTSSKKSHEASDDSQNLSASATGRHQQQPRGEGGKISVIGAGHGRSGTSSLVRALSRLGLKSYHMVEGAMESPGHLDLWHKYYVKRSISIDRVFDRIERDGFNATMDAPANFHYEVLLRRNPQALVILNVRKGGAQEWADSFFSTVFRFPPLLKRAPFRWFSKPAMMFEFLSEMNRELGAPVDPRTGLPDRDAMAALYEPWNARVRAAVPESQLLEFRVQDGWEPLCRFLSPRSAAVVEKNCREVLQSGEPFPRVNDSALIRRVVAALGLICSVVELSPFVIAMGLAGKLFFGTHRLGHPVPGRGTSSKAKVH
jgi:hypothetical protein